MLCLVALTTGTLFAQKGYEKSIELGFAMGIGDYTNSTFGATMINGYRFNDHFFTGVGVGFGYSNALNGVNINGIEVKEYRTDAYLIPVFAHFRANLTSGKTSPFLRLDVGYTFDVNQYLKDAPGVMIEPSVGVEFKTEDKKTFYALAGFNLQHSKYSYTKNLGSMDNDFEITNKSEMLKAISLKVGFSF